MARIRLVETEEDVETAIGDRQAELARLEGEPAIVGGETPPRLVRGEVEGTGGRFSVYLHPR